MSTPFVFSDEVPAIDQVAADDIVMVWDTSASKMVRATVTQVRVVLTDALAGGASTTVVIGFYGETGVDQGALAATAVTALATTGAPPVAGNDAASWAWASTTEAAAFVTCAKEAQTDLLKLMRRINSTGLVAIDGV